MIAIEEMGPERNQRAIKPKTDPTNEYIVAYFRAFFASPRRLIGYPSKAVTTLLGAPGMLISMAESAPEKTPTTYSPIMVAMASDVVQE